MPGGESTTIGKLLSWYGLGEAIVDSVDAGMALWGTCAGAILMAKEVRGGEVEGLGLMDIVVERNAYGRQLDSFETELGFGEVVKGGLDVQSNPYGMLAVPAVFIRAPKIVSVGEGVEVLAEYEGEIVAAREGKMLVTTFHPEMTDSLAVQEYFLGMV